MTRVEVLETIRKKQDAIQGAEIKLSSLKGSLEKFIMEQLPYELDLEYSDWDCVWSPIGMCVYNVEKDPAKDDCIYCHEPYERK